jgi:hypothetical protein
LQQSNGADRASVRRAGIRICFSPSTGERCMDKRRVAARCNR